MSEENIDGDESHIYRQCHRQVELCQAVFSDVDIPVETLTCCRFSATHSTKLLQQLEASLGSQKKMLLVSVSVDRLARSQDTIDTICRLAQNQYHGVMSLIWPSSPTHNFPLDYPPL